MLIGESMNTDELCFIVTGDLAFFYDMNALGIRHIKNNVRVLLINNGGGGEFKIMTRNWKGSINVEDYIAANGHNGTAKGWAEDCGFKYLTASSKDEFTATYKDFLAKSDSPILYEIFTTEDDEVIAMNTFLECNNCTPHSSFLKQAIKKIIGPKGAQRMKSIINAKS